MNLTLLKQVNRLWCNIYPYLVLQIMDRYQRDNGTVLELGPFSGGIAMELAEKYPNLEISMSDESSQVSAYFYDELKTKGLEDKIKIKQMSLESLCDGDSCFDLVIFRGAFFFLDEDGHLLRRIYRLLAPKGMAFVGGGYGKDTPVDLIDEISDESRELNDALGRKRVSMKTLGEIIRRSKIDSCCSLVKEGGLWVIVDKS